MSTVKVSLTRGDSSISVEGDRELVREELSRWGRELGVFDRDTPVEGLVEKELGGASSSFPDFYHKSNPKRGTQGLIAAKYLTDVKQMEDLRIADLNQVLDEVGHSGLSMPARSNLVSKGWLKRLGRGRYGLTDTGRRAFERLSAGDSLRDLPVTEAKKPKGKRGGLLAKYSSKVRPTDIVACLIAEKGPQTFEGIVEGYEKAAGPPPPNLRLLLKNMTAEKIGTAKLVGDKYQLTDKGQAHVKMLKK